jgi:hypothetical protein
MRTLILFLSISLSLVLPSLAQEVASPTAKEILLEQSKRQKKTGFILLGAGVGAAVFGGALFASNFCIFGCDSDDEALAGTGGVLFLLGVGSAIASVPVLINAGSKAKKAAELSFNPKPIYLPKGTFSGPSAIPSLSLSIPISGRKEKEAVSKLK